MHKFCRGVGLSIVLAIIIAISPVALAGAFDAGVPVIKDVPQYLQDISVTISCGNYQGSGVLFVSKDGQTWVWTCGHLVEGVRTEREATADTGHKTVVEFADAKIIKVLTEDGRKVGEHTLDAEVVRYSNATFGEDLALLRIRSKKFKAYASAQFWLDEKIPPIGTELYHCGSLMGLVGSNSLTSGIISQQGRVFLRDKIFDQTTCTAFPGSSGGIVCDKKSGKYVGMLTRGAGEGFNLIVPVRRMKVWAAKVGIEFAMNPELDVPTDDKLKEQPIDDAVGRVVKVHNEKEQKVLKTFLYGLQPKVEQIALPIDQSYLSNHGPRE